jgi:hypothetical protein
MSRCDLVATPPFWLTFFRNSLSQSKSKYTSRHTIIYTTLSILQIYFEAVNGSIESSRNIAKQELLADSQNLLLWHAYANSEALHKNIKEARRVYSKALSLCPSLPEKGMYPFME